MIEDAPVVVIHRLDVDGYSPTSRMDAKSSRGVCAWNGRYLESPCEMDSKKRRSTGMGKRDGERRVGEKSTFVRENKVPP